MFFFYLLNYDILCDILIVTTKTVLYLCFAMKNSIILLGYVTPYKSRSNLFIVMRKKLAFPRLHLTNHNLFYLNCDSSTNEFNIDDFIYR